VIHLATLAFSQIIVQHVKVIIIYPQLQICALPALLDIIVLSKILWQIALYAHFPYLTVPLAPIFLLRGVQVV
jgi:hypothetical protein